MYILRTIRREGPLKYLRNRVLVAFPWEVGFFRYVWFTRRQRAPVRRHERPSEATRELGYSHSYFSQYGPDRRVLWTMFLISSIPDCPRDSLLIIGPRYEPELLLARGLGWDHRSIRGLDTFSYSPWIDTGDMHQMPYPDESFSGIVCGWTLSYSSDPETACREMSRVLKPGGYLVIAMQKVPEDYVETLDGVPRGEDRVQTLEQLDVLFDGLRRVAGFEPSVQPGQEGHTMAAYRKDPAQ